MVWTLTNRTTDGETGSDKLTPRQAKTLAGMEISATVSSARQNQAKVDYDRPHRAKSQETSHIDNIAKL